MQEFSDSPQFGQDVSVRPQRSRAIWWILGAGAVMAILGCSGVIGYVVVLGVYGPETSVYTGNRIPSRFTRTIESVGALDDDEKILYFYSDAMTDIRDGFYFVSDKKVVIYLQDTDSPLTKVPFESIAEVELDRHESFFEDSEITLFLHDGQVYSFPVSSEHDRDQQFFDAIHDRTADADSVSE